MKLHEIFEKLADTQPEATAVLFKDENLSYAELNEKANQLAYYLRAKFSSNGKQPVIGVHLNRSIRPLISLLAISKIGGIYVPLDPAQNVGQLKEICSDSKINAIIVEKGLFLEHTGQTICLDKNKDDIANCYSSNPDFLQQLSDEEQIAYYCYSSGTTGKPKGIPIAHKGLHEWFKVLEKESTDSQADPRVILGNVSINFDAHIWEYLMAWALGGSLCIADDNTRYNTAWLVDFIADNQITDATLTPSVLEYFARQAGAFEKFTSLKAVYSTGEAATAEIIEACLKQRIKFYNCYGPTEATFGLTMYLIKYLSELRNGVAPIGLPNIPGIETYILNDKNEVVTDGTPGQLAFASPYMTKGYLNKEEQTQKKFTKITVKGADGKSKTVKIHLTGDQCVKENGQLFCLGRIDHKAKIKIRGVLVEPTGIEAFLEELKDLGISQARVVVKENKDQDIPPYLVAYYTVDKDKPAPLWKDIQNRLIEKFGAHSANIPQLQKIDAIPLNINGKTDREALIKKPNSVYRDESRKYISPKVQLEQELTAIWANLLHIPQNEIGLDDDFGALGGNSLSRMAMLTRLNEKYNIDLLPADVFETHFTINHATNLIIHLKTDKDDQCKPILIKKQLKNSKNNLFLLPSITGDGPMDYAGLARELKNVDLEPAVYTFKAPGLINPLYNNSDLNSLIVYYYQLIIKQQPKGPYFLGGWSSGSLLALGVANKLKAAGHKVAYLGLIDQAVPQAKESIDRAQFASNFLNLIEHLPGELKTSISQDDLAALPCEEQITHVFAHLRPNKTATAEKTLEVVKASLYGQLNHKFANNNTPLHVIHTPNIVPDDWAQYGNLNKTSRINGDHFSIISAPNELAAQLATQLRSTENSAHEERGGILIRRGSNSSNDGSNSDGSDGSPSASPQLRITPTREELLLGNLNSMVFDVIDAAVAADANVLAILALSQYLISAYQLALDRVSSCQTVNLSDYANDAETFKYQVSRILNRLDSTVFTDEKSRFPTWLNKWKDTVRKDVAEDKTKIRSITDTQAPITKLQQFIDSPEAQELNPKAKELNKSLKTDTTFLSALENATEAVNELVDDGLSKKDPTPLFKAIVNKTAALANRLERTKSEKFKFTL